MEKTAVQKLAGVLKILVTITFVCNLIVLPLVPVLVSAAGGLLGLVMSALFRQAAELKAENDLTI